MTCLYKMLLLLICTIQQVTDFLNVSKCICPGMTLFWCVVLYMCIIHLIHTMLNAPQSPRWGGKHNGDGLVFEGQPSELKVSVEHQGLYFVVSRVRLLHEWPCTQSSCTSYLYKSAVHVAEMSGLIESPGKCVGQTAIYSEQICNSSASSIYIDRETFLQCLNHLAKLHRLMNVNLSR